MHEKVKIALNIISIMIIIDRTTFRSGSMKADYDDDDESIGT